MSTNREWEQLGPRGEGGQPVREKYKLIEMMFKCNVANKRLNDIRSFIFMGYFGYFVEDLVPLNIKIEIFTHILNCVVS